MESLNDALIACVRAAGGSAIVGPKLWPEKPRDAAQRALLDCLNEDRPAKLSPEQVLLVLRLARAKGYHEGMNFIAADLGYGTPVPIEPRDEAAELQRQFIESVRLQQALVERMERAAGRLNVRVVA
jgi:hypothetical protein